MFNKSEFAAIYRSQHLDPGNCPRQNRYELELLVDQVYPPYIANKSQEARLKNAISKDVIESFSCAAYTYLTSS